jgi:hypothetical protein
MVSCLLSQLYYHHGNALYYGKDERTVAAEQTPFYVLQGTSAFGANKYLTNTFI